MNCIKMVIQVALCLPVLAFGQSKKASTFTITGDIKNSEVSPTGVYIKSMEENENNYKVEVKNNHYIITGSIDGPTQMNIVPLYPKGISPDKIDNKILFLYIEPGNTSILHSGSFSNMTITGSATQKAFDELNELVEKEKKKEATVAGIKEVYREYIQKHPQSPIVVYAIKAIAESDDTDGTQHFSLESLPLDIRQVYLQRMKKTDLNKVIPLFKRIPARTRTSAAARNLNIRIEYAKIAALQEPYFIPLDSLASLYIQASKTGPEDQLKELVLKMYGVRSLIYENVYAGYLTANPKTAIAIPLLKWYAGENFSAPSKAAVLYRIVSDSLKRTKEGKEFNTRLSIALKNDIRQMAPDFTQPDTAGNPVSLKSFRGKYVLIDFWASWCVFCRKENPGILKTYKQYREKGFEVISVSLDTDKQKWLDAIHNDGLTWTHVSDLKQRNAVVQQYDILGIPANLLVGPDGKIIARNLNGIMLYNKVTELFKNKEAVSPTGNKAISGKLENGFTYFIQKNTHPANRVQLYLVNKVGSLQEDDDQRGLAHFLEHMGFNGTKNFPKNELVSYLQKAGVGFGNDLNASTDFDATIYQLPIPTDNPELLNNGLQIIRDWAQDVTLDPVEIDKERGVILEEKRIRNNVSLRLQEKSFPLLLNNPVYTQRMPIGTEDILKNFRPETIRRFYTDWYRPNLQALIIVGDIDVSQMEKRVKELFSDLKNPQRERKRVEYPIPLNGKNSFLVFRDAEYSGTGIQVMIKYPELIIKTEKDYRRSMIRALFNRMISERFSESSSRAKPAYINAGAYIGNYLAGLDVFQLSVIAKPGEFKNGFIAAWEDIEKIKRFGFTKTELARAGENYLSSLETKWKEKDKTPSLQYVSKYINYFLRGEIPLFIDAEYPLAKEQIKNITINEVNNEVKAYFSDQNRDIIIMAAEDDSNKIPQQNEVTSWISTLSNKKISPYKDDMSKVEFFTEKPAGGRLISEKEIEPIGAKEWLLSNGVRIIVKPTDFQNDRVLINAYSPGGTSLYSDEDFESAANAADIIANSGAGNFTATRLNKFLTIKNLGFTPFINEGYEGFYGTSSLKDFESFLQLSYLFLTKPRKDSAAFQNMVEREQAALLNRGNDPYLVFRDTIGNVLNNYHVRKTPPSLEKLKQVSLDKAYKIYKERLGNAAGFTIVITGNPDLQKIKPLVEKYWGSLPSTGKTGHNIDIGIRIPKGIIIKKLYSGKQDKASVQLVFSGDYTYSEPGNDQVDALGEILKIKLMERLRELESAVYTVDVSTSHVKYPYPNFSITISFTCAPGNADKLVAAIQEEINAIKNNGVDKTDVQKYKEENIRAWELSLKSNNFWQYYILKKYRENDDITEVLHYKENLEKITPESLKISASRYLSGNNLIQFILLPVTVL